MPPDIFLPPTRYSGPLWAGLRVGLLGGSFNPAHAGHLHISRLALKRLRLDAVWWMISPQNPLKSMRGMASLSERLTRAREVADDPRIVVSDIECVLDTRYTADTLARLHSRFPRTRFVWLMGADNLIQIRRWRRWESIFETTPVAVFDRPPYLRQAPAALAARRYRCRRMDRRGAGKLACSKPPACILFRTPLKSISATEIRNRLGTE